MDYASLTQAVLDHQFSPNRYTTFIQDTLNEAQRRVARRTNMRVFFDVETVSTVAGMASYALPTDFARNYSLTEPSQSTPLQKLLVSDFDDLPDDSTGRPSTYTIDRPNLVLYPNPDAVYALQLRFYRTPVTMVEDDDEPELPEDYHHILVTYTLARCFRRENDYEATQFHQNEYERELAELQAALQDDDQDMTQPEQVGGMWSQDATPGMWVSQP